jgi:hypothetical protein
MQKLVFFSLLGLVILVACSKDNIETKPNISIKSISSNYVPVGVPLEINLNFTDKQGDIDTLFVHRFRVNERVVPTVELTDNVIHQIPEFPEKNKGEIKVTMDYVTTLVAAANPPDQPDAPNGKEPDSLIFKFILMDKAKNLSDTLTTDLIVVERS